MGQNANTTETYDVSTIREDIQDILRDISPMDFVFMSNAKTRNVSNTFFETAERSLASAVSNNQVAEGEASPANDAQSLPVRIGNYTEISDKVVEVSDTSQKVSGVANAQTIAEGIATATKELKRDMETSLFASKAGNAGSANAGGARVTAGLPTWLRTNLSRATGGANPTLSGTTTGFPNAVATDAISGNMRAISQALLQTVISSCWTNGATPKILSVGPVQKQAVSGFAGNASKTREQANTDGIIMAGMGIFISDFGEISIIPSRFQRTRDAFVLDPEHMEVAYLSTLTQKPLARTGHSERRLLSVEFGSYVYEKAHGVIADLNA